VADLLDVARGQMSAFNRGDVEAFVDQFTEDAEWWPLRSETEGPYRGTRRAARMVRRQRGDLRVLHADVDSAHEVPGGVIAFGALDVKGRGSHAAVRVPIAWYFRLRGDKVRWARAYSDRAAALRDAGVTEDRLR